MAALKEHNIKTAIVTYSCAGDSGDVDGGGNYSQESHHNTGNQQSHHNLTQGEFVDGQHVYRKDDVEQPNIGAQRVRVGKVVKPIGLPTVPILVIANDSFNLTVVAVRQASQCNGKSQESGVLYFIGLTSELFSQFSLRFSGWVNPMSAA